MIKISERDRPTVLVTGSSKGIGQATAIKFAQEGYDVVITYNTDPKGAKQTEKNCREFGVETLVLHLDVREVKSIEKTVRDSIKKFENIDVLVNNAGVYREDDNDFSDMDAIQDIIQTNLIGMIQMTKVLGPNIKKAVVNMASVRGLKGDTQSPAYNASKWGVRGFSRSLAEDGKLKVFNINPDTISTQMTDFEGRPPEDVANVIFNAVKGKYGDDNGEDINVWIALGESEPN